MKIAHFGATGNAGSRIVAEALQRGHEVTAIARHPEKLPAHPQLTRQQGDVNNQRDVATLTAGHDAVISSVRFQLIKPDILLGGLAQANVKRLLVVGGAATLEVAPGVQLLDTPGFPEAYKPEALGGRDFLNRLRSEKELEWTFLSPSAEFAPGPRTGKFRIGDNRLLTDADGKSWISMEDYAIAMIDELESPRHVRQRFTVGY
jgi:putative NADH-flavin reductase